MKRLALSLLLLAVVAVWGWTFVLVKDAVASCGVLSFLAIRCAIAVVLLSRYARGHDTGVLALGQLGAATVVFLAAWPVAEPFALPPRAAWPAILISSGIATAVAFYVQTLVQQRLPAIQVAMILLMEPLFAAFFGHLLARDRLTKLQVLGAALMVGAMFATELRPTARSAVDSRGAN